MSVALAFAVAVVLGASDDDVADMLPMPMMAEEPASGLPALEGAWRVGSAPLEPAVAASSPRVALAVFPFVVLEASMFTPGSSVDPELGVCGVLAGGLAPATPGRGEAGAPGTRRASSGPALATTWPG